MATTCASSRFLLYFLTLLLFLCADSLDFQMPSFDQKSKLTFYGDATIIADNYIDLTSQHRNCYVGWAIYSEPLRLWDSDTGKLTDFASHFSFTVNIQSSRGHGDGFTFFLARTDFSMVPNSAGAFMGLFNSTTKYSDQNQILFVEFDSVITSRWDPSYEHVGININKIMSNVTTPWNASLHSGDPADVWINYNATTHTLHVSWNYQQTNSPSTENSSLTLRVDLREILPEFVMIGFSAATGAGMQTTLLRSWDFNSTLNVKEPRQTLSKAAVAASVSAAAIVIAVVAFALIRTQKQKRKKNATQQMNLISVDDLEGRTGPRKFSYKELVLATNNFSMDRKLGEGGFGAVFRGYVTDLDIFVAVKKILRSSKQGKKQYVTEVKVISSLRHRNLVQLIGWCHDGDQFCLVYEFMPNGSLDGHLFDCKSHLSWVARYKIALGLGSALLYLHEEWEQCVVHRDIKSSNVMLDSSFNAKLGDFGLARLMDHELGPQTTGLAGTFGYMAPEYVRTGRASKETDVFSFGGRGLRNCYRKKSSSLY